MRKLMMMLVLSMIMFSTQAIAGPEETMAALQESIQFSDWEGATKNLDCIATYNSGLRQAGKPENSNYRFGGDGATCIRMLVQDYNTNFISKIKNAYVYKYRGNIAYDVVNDYKFKIVNDKIVEVIF